MAPPITQSPCPSDMGDDGVDSMDDGASVLSFQDEDVIDARLVQMFGNRESVFSAVNVFYRK